MEEDYTGKVAATVILREGSFLIARRDDNGEWEFPGGKQHTDETLLETSEREIKEELDIKVEASDKSPEHSFTGGGYDIVPVKASPIEKDFDIKLEDHIEIRWINIDQVGKELLDELGDEVNCLEAFDVL